MLRLVQVSSNQDKLALVDSLDISTGSWVVSDLRSKIFLRDRLHAKAPLLPDDCILRASDLWSDLLKKSLDGWQLVPAETMQLLVLKSLRGHPISVQKENLAELLMDYFGHWVGVFFAEGGERAVEDFLQESPHLDSKWGQWFRICQLVWKEIAKARVYCPSWSASLLNVTKNWENYLERDYVFDLGMQFNNVELEIIERISSVKDVTVIEPLLEKRSLTYQQCESLAQEKSISVCSELNAPPMSFLRMTTPLAEVKDVVSKIRQLVEQGVDRSEIVISAPAIEPYWPLLSSYLDVEGIGARKPVMMRLNSLPTVQSWLGLLRLNSGHLHFHDLEMAHFKHGETPGQNFQKFKYLFEKFASLDEFQDIKVPENKDSVLDKTSFLVWSLSYWSYEENWETAEEIVQDYLMQTPMHFSLTLDDHINLLERLVGRKEKKVRDESYGGVEVVPIAALEYAPAKRVFVLGLNSEALKASSRTQLSFEEALLLTQKTGFLISHPEEVNMEWELSWLVRTEGQEFSFYFSETATDGAALSPSLFWLLEAFTRGNHADISLPDPSRWDEIQRQEVVEIAKVRGWDESTRDSVERTILTDLGEQPLAGFGSLDLRYSASTVESFFQCPFLVATRKVFKLVDESSVDMDLDAAKKGRLMHKIFEILKKEPDVGAEEAVDQAYKELSQERHKLVAHQKTWSMIREKYIDLAKRFLKMEGEWSRENPHWKVQSTEKLLEGYFDRESKKFSEKPSPYPFVAFVDRIDSNDEGESIVIDYKSSLGGQTHHKSWLSKKSLQIPIYTALSELEPTNTVVGGVYYVVKEGRRDVGFLLEGSQVEKAATRYNKISPEAKTDLLAQIGELIDSALEEIEKGQLSPKPEDEKTCNSCRWRRLCRAPHLN